MISSAVTRPITAVRALTYSNTLRDARCAPTFRFTR